MGRLANILDDDAPSCLAKMKHTMKIRNRREIISL
jgi:hypothetical protein